MANQGTVSVKLQRTGDGSLSCDTSTAEYDKLGNVTKLAGPLGGATNYSYDEMGRLISESTASGGTITYGYNALNVKEQLTKRRTGDGSLS